MTDWTWQQNAACRGEDEVLFFTPEAERPHERDIRERKAKAICSQCPVLTECLDYALSRPEKYGFWGGLDERQRAAERRRIQRRGLLGLPSLTKSCTQCGKTKSTADFGSDKSRDDGLSLWCKHCTNEAARRRRREAKEAVAS